MKDVVFCLIINTDGKTKSRVRITGDRRLLHLGLAVGLTKFCLVLLEIIFRQSTVVEREEWLQGDYNSILDHSRDP